MTGAGIDVTVSVTGTGGTAGAETVIGKGVIAGAVTVANNVDRTVTVLVGIEIGEMRDINAVEGSRVDEVVEGNTVTVVVTVLPKNPANPPSVVIVTVVVPTVIVEGTVIVVEEVVVVGTVIVDGIVMVVGTVVVIEYVLVVGNGVNVVAAIVLVTVTVKNPNRPGVGWVVTVVVLVANGMVIVTVTV
jgi:hypothetical protein